MKETLTHVQQRARAYWFADGLNEIVGGLFAATLGALIWWQSRLQDTPQADVLSTAANLFLLAGVFLLPVLLRWMKERVTYPRSGYVAYPEMKPAERLKRGIPAMLIGFLLAALIVISTLASSQTRLWAIALLIWLPTLMGVLVGGRLLQTARATGLLRQFVLGGISIVTAAWLGWRSYPLTRLLSPGLLDGSITESMPAGTAAVMQTLVTAMYSNVAILLIVVGGGVLILGAVARLRYLKETANARPE